MSEETTPTTDEEPCEESLREQLKELNARFRFYSAQAWHVPFAYWGIAVVALAQLWGAGESSGALLGNAYIVAAVGGIIISHICHIKQGGSEQERQET